MTEGPARTTKISEQGVQTPVAALRALENARWDDLATFVEITERGSLRRAAISQGISVNTVRARVERLERDLSTTLLLRTAEGTKPTAAGLAIARTVREMRLASRSGAAALGSDVLSHPGELVIGCSEGLASLWLTPRLIELQRMIPNLTISLQCDYDLERDRSDEVDVLVGFGPPKNPDMLMRRLGTLHMMLFASEPYLRAHGTPAALDALDGHHFIEQAAPGLNPGLLDYFIGLDRPKGFVSLRSNASLSVFWAVANGVGIAALPTYVRAVSRRIVPLDLPFRLRFDITCSFRPEAKASAPVRAAVDWLVAAFDAELYPWFGERFLHPHDFPQRGADCQVVSLFSGMLDA